MGTGKILSRGMEKAIYKGCGAWEKRAAAL